MAKDSSFGHCVTSRFIRGNKRGITMATKEIKTRYDFKGNKSEIISLKTKSLFLFLMMNLSLNS